MALTGAAGITTSSDITTTADRITFNGAVTLPDSIQLEGSTVTFADTLTAGGTESLTVVGDSVFTGDVTNLVGIDTQGDAQNIGAVTISGLYDADTVDVDNSINANAFNVSGTSNVGADISTASTQAFGGAVTLSGGDRTLTASGLDFNSTIDGGNNSLTLNPGSAGTIDVLGEITDVDALTIVDSDGAIFRNDVTLTSVTITDTSDGETVSFLGDLNAQSLNTTGEGYGLSLLGANSSIDTDTTLLNTGEIVLGNQSTDIIRFINGLDATAAGSLSAAGTITTEGQDIDLANITVTDSVVFDTTNEDVATALTGADISLNDVTQSTSGNSISLNAGTEGIVTVSGDVDISTFDVLQSGGASVLGDIDATEVSLNAGTEGALSVAGTIDATTLEVVESGGAQFLNDVTVVTLNLTGTSAGDTIQFDGNLSATALNTTAGQGYNLSFNGDSTSIRNGVVFNNTGGLSLGNEASDDILFDGGAQTDAATTVNVFGSVRTTNDVLTLGNVVVGGASSLQTSSVNLILSGITSSGNQSLDVTSGAITVSGAVDDVALTIKDSGGANFQGQVGAVSPVSFVIETTTPGQSINFSDDTRFTTFTTGAQGYALSFTGSSNQFANAVDFTNSGGITLGNDIDAFTFTNGVTNSSLSTVSLSAVLRTDDAAISLGNVDLNAGQQSVVATTLTTGAASTTGANISFGAVDGAASTLSIDAGTGGNEVVFAGSTNLAQLITSENQYSVAFNGSDNSIVNATIFNNTGPLFFGDAASDSIEFTGGITVNSTSATTVNGLVSTTGTALELQSLIVGEGGTARLDTNGGAVTISGSVIGEVGAGTDAAENLNVNAGDVTFGADVELNNVDVNGSTVTFNLGADLSGQLNLASTNSELIANDVLSVDGVWLQTAT